jgi:hypothetical protein
MTGEHGLIVDAHGNPTAVLGPHHFGDPYNSFSMLLRRSGVEQAGAVCRGETGEIRLRMMGGEFSLNGVVSAAAAGRELLGVEDGRLRVVCSSLDGLVSADVELGGDPRGGEAEVAVDLPRLEEEVRYQAGVGGGVARVSLPGIAHLLVPLCGDADALEERAANLLRRMGGQEDAALGVIFYTFSADEARIWPFVWVRKVDSLVAETSCGSGALAVGIHLSRACGGVGSLAVTQPSGGLTYVEGYATGAGQNHGTGWRFVTRAQIVGELRCCPKEDHHHCGRSRPAGQRLVGGPMKNRLPTSP